MNYKLISLPAGRCAFVDACDFGRINRHRWHVRGGYAVKSSAHGKLSMHREILGSEATECTDHRNGYKLDNRRSNLRPCTDSQNKMNCGPRRNNRSGCKGVHFAKYRGKYMASICANGKRTYLGAFVDFRDAKSAYNDAATKLHGEFKKP